MEQQPHELPIEGALEGRPGLYLGVPFDSYLHSILAMNHSTLKHARRTPAHLKHQIRCPDEKTSKAMELGTLVHKAVLEPDEFEAHAIEMPDFGDMRSSKRRTERDEWVEHEKHQDPHTIIVPNGEMDVVQRMRDKAMANTDIRQIIDHRGFAEATMVWHEMVDDQVISCKGRIDKYIPGLAFVDLKTTQNADHVMFERDAWKFGYFTAAAFYCKGLRALGEDLPSAYPPDSDETGFLIIAIENTPPYETRLFSIGRESLMVSMSIVDEWLATYARGIRTGEWPGYPEGPCSLHIPDYVVKQIQIGAEDVS